jgi:hypothetical protein
MQAKVIYPPLSKLFFNNLYACKTDLVLVAPYIKYGVAKRIVEVLDETGTSNNISLTLITNVSTRNFVSGASDTEALEVILKKIPQTSLIAIGNLHAKCYLFDSRVAIITSGNLTASGLLENLELGTEIIDDEAVGNLRSSLINQYGSIGKRISIDDLMAIKKSMEQYHQKNAQLIELVNVQAKDIDLRLEKFESPRVSFDSMDIPELSKQLKEQATKISIKLVRQPKIAAKIVPAVSINNDYYWQRFEMARNSARRRKLSTIAEWRALCAGELPGVRAKNERVPSNPHEVYRDEWIDWEDWLGTYLPFEQARALVRAQKIGNAAEWQRFTKEYADVFLHDLAHVPTDPETVYVNDWISWDDWLHGSEYLPFRKARSFIHGLQFRSVAEWERYITGENPKEKPPIFIPLRPQFVYARDWWDWNNWIGHDDRSRGIKYLDFRSAQEFVASLELKSGMDWERYIRGNLTHLPKKPENIPMYPKRFYWKEWKGSRNWVGAPEIEPDQPLQTIE